MVQSVLWLIGVVRYTAISETKEELASLLVLVEFVDHFRYYLLGRKFLV